MLRVFLSRDDLYPSRAVLPVPVRASQSVTGLKSSTHSIFHNVHDVPYVVIDLYCPTSKWDATSIKISGVLNASIGGITRLECQDPAQVLQPAGQEVLLCEVGGFYENTGMWNASQGVIQCIGTFARITTGIF